MRPGRPDKPELLAPRFVPRRRITKASTGRIALLHAIPHIELNGIDLSLDIAVRFADYRLPFDFVRDWMSVASDKRRHLALLHHHLDEPGSHYEAHLPMTDYGKRRLKPPLNVPARTAAKFSSAFYGRLAAEQAGKEAANPQSLRAI